MDKKKNSDKKIGNETNSNLCSDKITQLQNDMNSEAIKSERIYIDSGLEDFLRNSDQSSNNKSSNNNVSDHNTNKKSKDDNRLQIYDEKGKVKANRSEIILDSKESQSQSKKDNTCKDRDNQSSKQRSQSENQSKISKFSKVDSDNDHKSCNSEQLASDDKFPEIQKSQTIQPSGLKTILKRRSTFDKSGTKLYVTNWNERKLQAAIKPGRKSYNNSKNMEYISSNKDSSKSGVQTPGSPGSKNKKKVRFNKIKTNFIYNPYECIFQIDKYREERKNRKKIVVITKDRGRTTSISRDDNNKCKSTASVYGN